MIGLPAVPPRMLLALLLGLLLVSALVVGCSGTNQPSVAAPTPAPTGGPTLDPGPERAGEDGFRAFAGIVDRALRDGDLGFFAGRLQTVHIVCTADNVPPEVGDPACEFAGQEFDGLRVGHWRGHGAVAPAQATLDRMKRLMEQGREEPRDEFGSGAARVYALDFRVGAGVTIATAIVDGKRQVLGIDWVWADGSWRVVSTLGGVAPMALELLQPGKIVLETQYQRWERFPQK